MDEDSLYRAVQKWRTGGQQACWQVCEGLWQELFPVAVKFASRLDKHNRRETADAPSDLASAAFWRAMESLDLKVSGGRLLVNPTGKMKEITQKDGTIVHKKIYGGKHSGGKLTEQVPFVWRGQRSFKALLRDIWIVCCWSGWRKSRAHATYASLDSPRENTEEEHRDTLANQLPGDHFSPELLVAEQEEVEDLVAALAQVAEQLRDQHPTLAEVAEALLAYVKEQINRFTQELPHQTTLQPFAFDEAAAWVEVEGRLHLSRSQRYERKQRFREEVHALPQVPEVLFTSGLLPEENEE